MAGVFTLTFSQNKAHARETPTRVRGDRAGWDDWGVAFGVRGLWAGEVRSVDDLR
jgi:hypothetical protein